jgi:fatty acid desaturase
MPETAADSYETAEFSVAQARAIVRDLFEPNPVIYWVDFLLSMAVAYLGLAMLLELVDLGEWRTVGVGVGYCLSALALYRALSFIHELVHLKGPAFKPFRVAWNALCGIPLLVPSFMYYTHVEHHARRTYGTARDGEYLPLASQPVFTLIWYLLQPWFVPPLLLVRFLILAPLGWLIPPLRRLLNERLSSLVMNPEYLRPLPTYDDLRIWRMQEVACFLVVLTTMYAIYQGWISQVIAVRYYLMAVGMIYLNHVRTMGAHRFVHTGRELNFLEQLLDSYNYPERPWLTGLWAPIGLRFHALHHLFPAMPYHSLNTAHHRLMAQLPANSPYRQTNSSGLLVSLRNLFAQSIANSGRQRTPPSAMSRGQQTTASA